MQRENHSDVHRPDIRRSEARYGPGGSNTVRRRQELAAKAAARGSAGVRRAPAASRRRTSAPILSPARRRGILLLLSATALSSAVGIIFASPLMHVRSVQVSGVSSILPSEAEAVRSASAVAPGSNLFRLNIGALEKDISRLPWIASARVGRRFPSGLDVSIVPRVPAAHLRARGQDWEIDQAGVTIRPLRSGAKLPLIVCSDIPPVRPGHRADAAGLAAALKTVSDCKLTGGVRIAKVDIDRKGELCLNMSDNVAIRLGREEALPTKIDYVQRIYADRPGIATEVESIDLRWPESPSCVLRSAGNTNSDEGTPSTRHNSRTRTGAGGTD